MQPVLMSANNSSVLTPPRGAYYLVHVERDNGLRFLSSPDFPEMFAVVDADEKIRGAIERAFRNRFIMAGSANPRVLMNCDLSQPKLEVVVLE